MSSLDAAKLAGLLADDSRRRVFAALVLGAATSHEVAVGAGLPLREAVDALGRLVSAGLVLRGSDDTLVLVAAAFADAARAGATVEPRAADDVGRVVQTFVHDGRLTSMPTQRSKRLVVLDLIAQDFEPGLRYSEPEVNAIVGRWHDDYAMVRRWLVDELFLSREAGSYWRSGGNVDLDVG